MILQRKNQYSMQTEQLVWSKWYDKCFYHGVNDSGVFMYMYMHVTSSFLLLYSVCDCSFEHMVSHSLRLTKKTCKVLYLNGENVHLAFPSAVTLNE